jgi:hypothetical protein
VNANAILDRVKPSDLEKSEMSSPSISQFTSKHSFSGARASMYDQMSAQAANSPTRNFENWCNSNKQQLQREPSCPNISSPMTITSSDANNSSIDLGTGYQAKFSTNGASMQLFDHGKSMGTISGDPHAAGADGSSEGSFKQNMQFKLPDGSTISTRTSDASGGGPTYLEEAIVHRADGASIRVDGINKPGQMQTSVIPPGWGQQYADQTMLSDKGAYTADQVGVNDKGFFDPQTGKQMNDASWAQKDQHVTQMDQRVPQKDQHATQMSANAMADQAHAMGLMPLQNNGPYSAQGYDQMSHSDCKRDMANLFRQLKHFSSMGIQSQCDMFDRSGCKRRMSFGGPMVQLSRFFS